VDHGGKGNDSRDAFFSGGSTEYGGASVNLAFFGGNWSRRLTLRLLRREAEQRIQGPGTKPEKKPPSLMGLGAFRRMVF
jgi:hypothetical protein